MTLLREGCHRSFPAIGVGLTWKCCGLEDRAFGMEEPGNIKYCLATSRVAKPRKSSFSINTVQMSVQKLGLGRF